MPAAPRPAAPRPRTGGRRPPVATAATLAVLALLGAACGSTGATTTTSGGGDPSRGTAATSATMTPAATEAAQAASRDFTAQLAGTTAAFVVAVGRLGADVTAGDQGAARTDTLAAQAAYDGFRVLEAANAVNGSSLDELATDVGPAEQFGGLHAVERDLWTSGPLATDVSALAGQAPVAQFLLSRQRLGPEAVGQVAVDQLDWVVDTALPVSQEQYAHLGLVDVAATEQAAHRAFRDVMPLGHLVAPTLTATVDGEFSVLDGLVSALGDPSTTPDTAVTPAARLALSRQFDATASTLARLVARLAPFGTHGAPS
jgi:iron uptake system component EfeO